MRKRYLLVLIATAFIAVFSLIYFLTLSTPFSNYNEPQNQGNETPTPYRLPFRLPWEAPPATTNKSSGAGAGGSGSGGSGGSGSGGSGSGGGEETDTKTYYVLSANSSPEGLSIFLSYYFNNEARSITLSAPFNLEVDPSSSVCVLPASLTSKGILRWTVDGQECRFYTCEASYYDRKENLYSDDGCMINMDANHLLVLYFTSP